MKLSENRHIARAVLAVAVVAGLLLSARGALISRRDAALDSFAGKDGISADLIRRAESANLLAGLAESYGLDSDAVARVTAAAETIADASQSVASRGEAHSQLTLASDQLYTLLEKADLSDTDKDYAYSLYKEIQSRAQIIDHSDYDDLAAKYNKEVSAFPANLLSKLLGLGSLDAFR